MRLDDFLYILFGSGAVPGAFWVNNQAGAVFTAVEASGSVDAGFGYAQLIHPFFHIVAQGGAAAVNAAAALMAVRPFVLAEKNVMTKEKGGVYHIFAVDSGLCQDGTLFQRAK